MNQPSDSGEGRHVVVTGGAGYLGSVLVPTLLDRGYDVSVIDRFIFGEQSLAAVATHPRLHLYKSDITHLEELPSILRESDSVVHLASVSNDPTCDLDPNLSIQTNYLATTALARRARAEGVQQFIFASSCSVYGANNTRLLDESSHTGPVTLYALTKLASEREITELSSNDFRVTTLRFSTLFGLSPRMRFDLAVNAMTKRALQGKPLLVNGHGAQYRPFIHVRDAVEAIVCTLQADPARVRGQIFNVGGHQLNFTILGLAQEIQSFFAHVPIEQIEANEDVRSYRVRFQKIRDTLTFSPRRTIRDAMQEISSAYQAGALGTMEEEQFYNMAVMKKVHPTKASVWSVVSSPTVKTV